MIYTFWFFDLTCIFKKKNQIKHAIKKLSKSIFLRSGSESAHQKTAYKPVYEIDLEKTPETRLPFYYIGTKQNMKTEVIWFALFPMWVES